VATSDPDLIDVVAGPIDVAGLQGAVRRNSSGAVASFVGVVRDEHQGVRVHHLVYEAYPPMAQREMRRIAAEARAQWPIDAIALVHRVGRLEIGEASVAIVVAAPHRREALEACAFAIEKLKREVPIWKKEYSADGAAWVIGDPSRS